MLIAATARVRDGVGTLLEAHSSIERAMKAGLRIRAFRTAPLRQGFGSELPEGMVESACSPMDVIRRAGQLFADREADVVWLEGRDYLASEYSRQERLELVRCLPSGHSHLEGYEMVAEAFCNQRSIDLSDFRTVSAALYQNYLRTAANLASPLPPPDDRWFEPVNPYFRGVDCANPYIDFEGIMVLMTEAAAERCEAVAPIKVDACSYRTVGADGVGFVADVARYEHLTDAYQAAQAEAGVDFSAAFLSGEAALEAYTCYPVVPMAFLLASGLAADLDEVHSILARHEVTVTGGLNLARAPWNCTTLNNIIAMTEVLRTGPLSMGGVHGNGSLGYQQAFLILSRA